MGSDGTTEFSSCLRENGFKHSLKLKTVFSKSSQQSLNLKDVFSGLC